MQLWLCMGGCTSLRVLSSAAGPSVCCRHTSAVLCVCVCECVCVCTHASHESVHASGCIWVMCVCAHACAHKAWYSRACHTVCRHTPRPPVSGCYTAVVKSGRAAVIQAQSLRALKVPRVSMQPGTPARPAAAAAAAAAAASSLYVGGCRDWEGVHGTGCAPHNAERHRRKPQITTWP